MVPKKRVIFSGSRYWKHETSVTDVLINLNPDEWIVVTGGAKGLDAIAHKYADQMGFETEVYPANWRLHGKGAGPIRNQLMLSRENVQLVVAFPDPERSVGTYHMIEIAEEEEVDVIIVEKP